MTNEIIDDTRADGAVERLMEDSWSARSRQPDRRERLVETASSLLFLAISVPLAISALASQGVDWRLVVALVLMHALSHSVEFPIGAGYVVPSYIVLVPMLLLLPPGAVPLLVAASLALGAGAKSALDRARPQRAFVAVSDAWHALGPAAVLLACGSVHGLTLAAVYLAAFAAGCLVDLASATVREAAILGVDARVQILVIARVWLVDACIAPLGLLVAYAGRQHPVSVLVIVPLIGLLVLISRERTRHIAQSQQRLDLVARERRRLQTAVARLGEALAARLDLDAVLDIVLRGSVEALDADGGRFVLQGSSTPHTFQQQGPAGLNELLEKAVAAASANGGHAQVEHEATWALAQAFDFPGERGVTRGVMAVARQTREFRPDEQQVLQGLAERAKNAATEIVAHELLREQAHTDALTRLGNRRKLADDLNERLAAGSSTPLVLILFDLDGFKSYNDTFGHLAGDAVLARLGAKLASAVAAHGDAYRLGGDEFCVLVAAPQSELDKVVHAAAGALEERGERFAVGASYGAVLLPHEARTLDYALQLADERMYARKRGRPSPAGDQARDVLLRIMHAKQPSLEGHASEVAELCLRVGRCLGMSAEGLDELARAAELHDIGKVGIPDAILEKPQALDESEWEFMHQHTILGERILSAAPALRPVAALVRASHERWDGYGYPDGLAGERIPLGARIIAACDAYDAMTTDRVYRERRTHEDACRELREQAGSQFDPAVVDVLLAELYLAPPRQHAGEQMPDADVSADIAKEVVSELRAVLARHGDH